MNEPYTHAMHWTYGIKEAKEGRTIGRKHVQVKKRGVTYCAQIACAWTAPNGLDCWTVETLLPELARFTVPCRNVRDCPAASCGCSPVPAEGGKTDADRSSFSSNEASAVLTEKEVTCL